MPEEIAVQILAQASENIQKLFQLSTRIDERVKSMQAQHDNIERKLEDFTRRQVETLQKIAVLESKQEDDTVLPDQIGELEQIAREMDRRLYSIESAKGRNDDRWNRIASFVIQLVWVILASYILMRLNLQSPAIP